MTDSEHLNSSAVADSLPDGVIHYILSRLTSRADLDAVSLLNRHWHRVEGSCRRSLKVRNCFALSPQRLARRFTYLTHLTLVATPFIPEYSTIDWRFYGDSWIQCIATCCAGLQKLKLKRFILSHQLMLLISRSFLDLRSLLLVECKEIPSFGLGKIVTKCPLLQVLELRDCCGESKYEPWLSDFPEYCHSLVSLSFANSEGQLDLAILERLVSRSPNLKNLKFDQPLPPDVLSRILKVAPNLVEIGFGPDSSSIPLSNTYINFVNALTNYNPSVRSLSGSWFTWNLAHLSSLCSMLLFLDLSTIRQKTWDDLSLAEFIRHCHSLQRLWVLCSVGDEALSAVGETCKDLRELRVLRISITNWCDLAVTDGGLLAVAHGCRKLHSVTYTCRCMSNAALATFGRKIPCLRSFELTLIENKSLDIRTCQSFDEGFGSILQSCKNLNQLSIHNAYVTDQVFFFAGMFGAQLKKLSVAFAGDSNIGVFYALNLCPNLKQLMIRGGAFEDATLIAAADKFKNLEFVWICSGGISVRGAKILAEKFSTLSVAIKDRVSEEIVDLVLDREVQNLLIYQNMEG